MLSSVVLRTMKVKVTRGQRSNITIKIFFVGAVSCSFFEGLHNNLVQMFIMIMGLLTNRTKNPGQGHNLGSACGEIDFASIQLWLFGVCASVSPCVRLNFQLVHA
jgi:hypothetical protein